MYNSWNNKVIRVATRPSNLAIKQVEEIFSDYPELQYKIIPIESFGDKHKNISLIDNNIEDFFTRELDNALITGDADIAIHSAKDLPFPLSEKLQILALSRALDQTDSIVSQNRQKLSELPPCPKIGTSSLLRKSELLKIRSDIQIISIRGTIEERIQQVYEGSVDAVIIASCALKRLGLENLTAEVLPFETHPLQGHLAILSKQDNSGLKSLFSDKDIRKNYGKVSLIGFGPGDPGLLTISGLEKLQLADIIYYDDLLNSNFLDVLNAEKYYVGKRKGKHSYNQLEINKLLYKSVISGKKVVRLKGGDPMLFAHGGEEIEFLQKYLVETEVVPGITAALAASAYTKIPLTHRDLSSSVTFLTGHSQTDTDVPVSGTLVYYMGASNLPLIAKKLILKGWSPDTLVLMVYNVSDHNQEEHITTLLEAETETKPYKTPLIVIIGDVIKLKRNQSGIIKKPTLLITGSDPGIFTKYGRVKHIPFIELKALKDYSHLKLIIGDLHKFQWIIFTSRYAVQFFFSTLHIFKRDSRYLAAISIASIGASTTAELFQFGIVPDLQPENESSLGLTELFKQKNIRRKQILIPRSNIALPVLPDGLKKLNNEVTIITIYENAVPDKVPEIIPEEYNYIVFTSPSCVENFFRFHDYTKFYNQKFIVHGIETMRKLITYNFDISNTIMKESFIL
jgi:uroporphyrinogen III methyltransferase/synthase